MINKLRNSLIHLYEFKIIFSLTILYFVFISIVYAIMSIVQHSHYQTFGDLGVFNQGIWQYSQFKWSYITFHLNRPFLGDHFHPILVILAPLYWIYASEETLLVAQPFIILSTIIPLFLIANRLTKSLFFSLCIIFAYSLYLPVQYTIFYDFHEIVFLPPLFTWAFWFFLQNKRLLTAIFLILILLTKEELGFFAATFGLYLLIFARNWRLFGAYALIGGIAYSLTVINFIIPKIGGSYIYFDYGNVGQTPQEVFFNFLNRPVEFFKLVFTPDVKLETLHLTFKPFGYLPLFSPLSFLLSAEQVFSRFIDQNNTIRWTIGYHYSAPMAIIASIGALITVSFFSKFSGRHFKYLVILIGVVIIILTRLEQINRSAILLVKRPQFWERSAWMDSLDYAISLIPKDASVATQNNLTSHLSTRKLIYNLDNIDKAEYILVDFHQGQSAYNFVGVENWVEIEKLIKSKIDSGELDLIFNQNEVYLVRNTKT